MSPAGRQLESRVNGVRVYLERRVGLAMALWAGGVVALLLVVGWIFAGSDGWRQGSDVPVLLDAMAILAIGAGWLALRRGSSRWFGEAPLAAAIEKASGIRDGVLKGALELSRSTPHGVSGALVTRAVHGAVGDLDGRTESDLSGSLGQAVSEWTRRGLGFAGVVAFVFVALTVASPERTANLLSGVVSPLSTMRDPVLPPLAVQPGDVEVLRGTDVELDISAAGRFEVEVAWQAAGDVARSERIEVTEGRATYRFRTVSAAIEYRVMDADGNESSTYRIVPVDPLFVSDLVLSVTYPPHTGLPADEYRGDPPPLRLPAGSTLLFEGLTSRPLSSVELVDSVGAEVLGFEIDGANFAARWTPSVTGAFEWDFRDEMGGVAEIQPEPLEIVVVPDVGPSIGIPLPGRDTIMPLNFRQPLVLEAGDDYGLRRVELVAYRVTSFGERMEPIAQGFNPGGQRAVLARPLLDLRSWGLLPGDTVRYFARAIDNSPRSQVSVSEEYVLRMPEAAELRREAEDAFEEVSDRLEELAAEAERQATENREQALESATPRGTPEPGETEEQAEFEQREELERALANQEQMSAEVDSLRSEMDALEQMMEEAGQADPELRRQLEELQEMLSTLR